MATKPLEIVIIGAGKLATHLGLALVRNGFNIVQVYNRTPDRGMRLAGRIGASYTSNAREINVHSDICFFAVSDSVLGELATTLNFNSKLVVHCSGTVSMDILSPVSTNIGVFYPVQTFAHNRRIDFRKIPVCIEANSLASELLLTDLAKKLTSNVCLLNSEKRRLLHLGAVFASNFTNFLYTVAEDLMHDNEIPFDLLVPLILKTARNSRNGKPSTSQTGPAVRGDFKVLAAHRELLTAYPDYLCIYNLLSENIIKHDSSNGKL